MTDERAPGDGYLVLWAGGTEVAERDAQVELRRAGVRVEVAEVDVLAQRVSARAPDLVVLGGPLGEEPDEVAAAITARGPGVVVPTLALAPSSSAAPRPRARYGLVARFDRALPPATLASHVQKLLAALSTRTPTWRVSLRGNDLGPLAVRLARSGRAGILTVDSGAIVVQAHGPIAPRTHVAEPGHAQFHERPADRVRVLDAIFEADEPEPTLEGVRVLVVDGDADRREAITGRLEATGAQVRATGLVAQAVHASRVLDPAVIVVLAPALRSGAVLPLWSEPRLTAASLLVVDPRLAETEQGALVREVASLAGPAGALSARVGAQEAFAERLETLGPARWLKVLGRCEHDVTLRVFGAEGRARVDLTGGRIRGASFRPRAEEEVVEGRAAVDALMAMQFGRVLVGPPDALAALEGVSARRKPSVVGRIDSPPRARRAEPAGAMDGVPKPLGGPVPKPLGGPVPKPLGGPVPKPRGGGAPGSAPLVPKPAPPRAKVPRPSPSMGARPDDVSPDPMPTDARPPVGSAAAPPTERAPSAERSPRALAETLDELPVPASLSVPLIDLADGDDGETGVHAPEELAALRAASEREAPTPDVVSEAPEREAPRETVDPPSAPMAAPRTAEREAPRETVDPPSAPMAAPRTAEREAPRETLDPPSAPMTAPRTAEREAPRETLDPASAPMTAPRTAEREAPRETLDPASAPMTPVEGSPQRTERGPAGAWLAAGVLLALGVGGVAVWQLRPAAPPETARSAAETPALGAAPTMEPPEDALAAPTMEPPEDALAAPTMEPPEDALAAPTPEAPPTPSALAAPHDDLELASLDAPALGEPPELEPGGDAEASADGASAETPPAATEPERSAGSSEEPVNVFGLLEEARAAGRAGDYARSERLSREALEASPRNPRAGYRLAVSLFRLSRYEEAIEQAERTIRWDADDPLPVALIGDIHVHRGRFARGAVFYRRALEVDPSFEPAERALERLRARGVR